MSLLSHIGRFVLMLKLMFSKPENPKMYWKEFMHQCVEIGIGSLPIVVIISLFLGAVSTVQTAYQLVSPLIPRSIIGSIVRDTILLELAPTVVSIVLAGVIGSKIASELGNMRISEQIDALEIMGINTHTYLVLPKILGSVITIPFLITIAAVLGIWGGRVAGNLTGIIATDIFDMGLRSNFQPYNVFFALTKAFTFAFLISSISAYYGFHVKGGSLEIGRASTKAVVISCIVILLSDYLLASLLL